MKIFLLKEVYANKQWISSLLENGICMGSFKNEQLIGFILSEMILDNGVFVWFIVMNPEFQNMNYGTELLHIFEKTINLSGKKWMFLNSTKKAKNFYEKNGFMKNDKETFEMIKEF